MPDNDLLDDMFGDNEMPIEEVYRVAQKVVKTYMDKNNKKIDYIARELGTTQKRLYRVLDPNQPESPLSVDRIIQISRLTDDTRIVEKIAHEINMVAISNKRTIATTEMHEIVDRVSIESSDVFREAKAALKDGKINIDERDQILREVFESQSVLAELVNSLQNLKVEEE